MDLCHFAEGVVQLLDAMNQSVYQDKTTALSKEDNVLDSIQTILEFVYHNIPIVDPTQVCKKNRKMNGEERKKKTNEEEKKERRRKERKKRGKEK